MLGQVLKDVSAHLDRYVIFANPHQLPTVTLWVAVTWAIDVFDVAPYLLITAPERQSGKTRLLEVLEPIVRKPIFANNISPAALYRVIEKDHPTLLLDEIDSIYGNGPRSATSEELRGLIDAGHRRGQKTYRMGGGGKTKLESFDSFCVKALAGIDAGRHIPETIVDRSITIKLHRRAPDEQMVRYRRREVLVEAKALHERLEEALAGFTFDGWPSELNVLSDRATEIWEPLIVVADIAGEEWPGVARAAAESIYGTPNPADDSLGVRLLSDIREVIDSDRISTTHLVDALKELDEAPWGDLYGKAITPRKLADLLRPFGIASHDVRTEHGVFKGFAIQDFIGPWKRYLPPAAGEAIDVYEPWLQFEESEPELEAPF